MWTVGDWVTLIGVLTGALVTLGGIVVTIIHAWRTPTALAATVAPVAAKIEVVHELVNSQKAALIDEIARLEKVILDRAEADKAAGGAQ